MSKDPAAMVLERYRRVRAASEKLAAPLTAEDQVVQTMPDVSPTKWHLAHTTWFFETFVLAAYTEDYKPFHPRYRYLFNSYYNAVGPQFTRAHRGMLSRPTVEEINRYRHHVDEQMEMAFSKKGSALHRPEILDLITLGTHHEQQHQELILTDIKHVLGQSPLHPNYLEAAPSSPESAVTGAWCSFDGGVHSIGFEGKGFHFDNEGPRHRVLVEPYQMAQYPVTVGEYLQFIEAGGYKDPTHWLSEGWSTVQREGWTSPMYWSFVDGAWQIFTLRGLRPLVMHEPVCHVSYYEADAFARWVGARLPTEAEWELASTNLSMDGNFVEQGHFHPKGHLEDASSSKAPQKLFGDVWEWTASPYLAYPGYRPAEGAVGEYNGKFMCDQWVLRGGSCATPQDHIRSTYRNFFPSAARWQFSGFRLARGIHS